MSIVSDKRQKVLEIINSKCHNNSKCDSCNAITDIIMKVFEEASND